MGKIFSYLINLINYGWIYLIPICDFYTDLAILRRAFSFTVESFLNCHFQVVISNIFFTSDNLPIPFLKHCTVNLFKV